jgi:uncharacterized membrane protein YidH (DUF202 family)
MHATITGFAALALMGFGLAFALLMLFMALIQPIWSVIDCAVDKRRGTLGKVLWILALILLWGVASWFYGAFAAANKGLLRLTRLAWAFAIGLIAAFLVIFNMNGEFRRGIEDEWRNYRGGLVAQLESATTQDKLGGIGRFRVGLERGAGASKYATTTRTTGPGVTEVDGRAFAFACNARCSF